MKILYPLLITIVIILTACAPPPPSKTEEGPVSFPSNLGQATPTPNDGNENLPQPEVFWDSGSEKLIVSATFCCGYTSETVRINYIPDAQIWGDGRIVWTHFDTDGVRSVLASSLTTDQMTAWLQRAVDQGFFGWQELYINPLPPSDLPSQCLSIELESQTRKVCEYDEGAPQAFHDLYDDIASGMQFVGEKYQPARGYLLAESMGSVDSLKVDSISNWDSVSLGMLLSQGVNGAWIEGPALEAAWELVNTNPWGATVVKDGEVLYQISLQVPGLSMTEPPVP